MGGSAGLKGLTADGRPQTAAKTYDTFPKAGHICRCRRSEAIPPVLYYNLYGDPDLVDWGRPGPKLNSSDVVLIGVRDLDPPEREMLADSGVTVYTMREIDERGMAVVPHAALESLSHLSRLHVSLDMDGLDPSEAPGVGAPVPGGLTYREAHLLMEIIADCYANFGLDYLNIFNSGSTGSDP